MGTYHWMSVKHLHRYIKELAGRHNLRPLEPLERIAKIWEQLIGKPGGSPGRTWQPPSHM